MKNILFDLGGVVIDIDINKTLNKLSQLLDNKVDDYKELMNNPIFKKYEIGQISSDEFLNELHKLSDFKASKDNFADAWNSMIIKVPTNRIKLIEEIRKNKKLYVLSNTNELHVNHFNKMIPGYDNLDKLFEKVYYSHEIGYRKPKKESFEYIINDSKIIANETLFLDDNEDNIITAKNLGFKTYQIKDDEDLANLHHLFI